MKCSYQEAKSIMEKMNFRALDYVPTKEEMEKEILPNIKLYFSFLLWIELTGYETEENKKNKRTDSKASYVGVCGTGQRHRWR